jgi:hypothetical protein
VVLVVLLVAAPISPAGAVPSESVVATDDPEAQVAASLGHVAWSRWRDDEWDVFAMALGGEPIQVNPEGREAALGGIDGSTLVYQEYVSGTWKSDIWIFDLETETRAIGPDLVNTRHWEYWPSSSADLLLFGRQYRDGHRELLLYDAASDTLLLLDSTVGPHRDIQPGQVGGNYVVWATYSPTSCEVFVHDVAAGTTARVPNPGEKCQYAPSVNQAGTVFYGRGGFTCGTRPSLLAYPIGGPAETLVSLGRGRDFGDTYAVDIGEEATDVYFDPGPCGGDQDIRRVTVEAAAA